MAGRYLNISRQVLIETCSRKCFIDRKRRVSAMPPCKDWTAVDQATDGRQHKRQQPAAGDRSAAETPVSSGWGK